ncbi:hypothetical protein [Kineococcus sp. SYSU DK003]|uniref:hypothetical protein n=1 Tax=Kineococcus sp. SYSU DK003 TaxID=3383124 RepID=UPI003D7EAAA8
MSEPTQREPTGRDHHGHLPHLSLPGRGEPLPAHWADLPWPRPTPAAVVTVLARALAPQAPRPRGGPADVLHRLRSSGVHLPRERSAPEVGAGDLPGYDRVRAATGVAAMSVEEFGDEEAFGTGMWLRAWVRTHRSPAVRAWVQARYPDLPPEVVTRTAREVSVELALAVVDVEVLVVGLREGWSDAWTVAVLQAGFGAGEAVALHGREDAWEVLATMAALTGGGWPPRGPGRAG